MATADERVAKLEAARVDLVRLRREYAETADGEGVARYQLAIEAVDRAIIDERAIGNKAPEGPSRKGALPQMPKPDWVV